MPIILVITPMHTIAKTMPIILTITKPRMHIMIMQ